MTTFKIKKGKNFSRPRKPKLFWKRGNMSVIGKVKFTDNSQYCVNADCSWKGDQKDWNKLTGIELGLFSPAKSTVMLAWRYNTEINKIQIAPYLDDKDGVDYLPFGVYDVEWGEEVKFVITYHVGSGEYVYRLNIGDRDPIYEIGEGIVEKGFNFGWRVQPYFGGNTTAPRDVSVDLCWCNWLPNG